MSYYCKGLKCDRRNYCYRADGWDKYCQRTGKTDEVEGFSTCVWFVNENECMSEGYKEGVFPS